MVNLTILSNPDSNPPWFNLPNAPFIIPFVKWDLTFSPGVLGIVVCKIFYH